MRRRGDVVQRRRARRGTDRRPVVADEEQLQEHAHGQGVVARPGQALEQPAQLVLCLVVERAAGHEAGAQEREGAEGGAAVIAPAVLDLGIQRGGPPREQQRVDELALFEGQLGADQHALVEALGVALALCAAVGSAQEVAKTNRATELKAQARSDAPTVTQLASGAPIRILERAAGGWARVDAAGKMGWVRSFAFTLQGTVDNSGSSSGPSLASIAGSSRPQQAGIASIGVRGLTKEEMKKAHPDPAELAKLRNYAQSRDQGDQFGRVNRLQTVSVAYVGERGQPLAGAK